MSLFFFLIAAVFLLALSSFSLAPFLSTGVLFFAWLGYGFLRFSFKLSEVFIALVILAVFFSLLSGLNVFFGFLLLSLPLIIPLLAFKNFAKLSVPLKTFFGGLIYLILIFLGMGFLGLISFVLLVYSVPVLFALVALEFFVMKVLKKRDEI